MAEPRCPHGFLLSIVNCPSGCGGRAEARRLSPSPPASPGLFRRGRPRADRHPGFRDLTGCRFGSWLVLAEVPSIRDGNTRWQCRHDCGAVYELDGIRVRNKPPKFCASCRRSRRVGAVSPEELEIRARRVQLAESLHQAGVTYAANGTLGKRAAGG